MPIYKKSPKFFFGKFFYESPRVTIKNIPVLFHHFIEYFNNASISKHSPLHMLLTFDKHSERIYFATVIITTLNQLYIYIQPKLDPYPLISSMNLPHRLLLS